MAYQPSERHLIVAGWLFAAGSAIHLFDHLRRGQDSVTEQLYWAGNMALILQVVVITLILIRHPKAALVAAAAGPALAIGFLAAHWLPEWSRSAIPSSTATPPCSRGSPRRPRSPGRWPWARSVGR